MDSVSNFTKEETMHPPCNRHCLSAPCYIQRNNEIWERYTQVHRRSVSGPSLGTWVTQFQMQGFLSSVTLAYSTLDFWALNKRTKEQLFWVNYMLSRFLFHPFKFHPFLLSLILFFGDVFHSIFYADLWFEISITPSPPTNLSKRRR